MPDATDLLLVKSGGASVFHEWIDGFAACCPGLTVKEWDDTSVRDDEVTYVLVGQPVHGRLALSPS
jgi:glyoxylate/hydroxypyruvate reductase A